MSREKEFIKNSVVLAIGKFLPKLTSFVTLPILTAYLSKAEYGTYDLITTLVMLLIPVATLQIQSAAFRFLIDCRENEDEKSSIITNICVVSLPITFVVSLIIPLFLLKYNIFIKILIALYFFSDAMYQTIGQIVRGLGNNKQYSIASIINAVINMILVIVMVSLLGEGLTGVMIALDFANLIALIFFVFSQKIYQFISFNKISIIKIKELLKYSWPMIPNNLSTWILKLSDRIVITMALGIEANAVYAVANKIPNLLSIGQQILVMAWQENASIAAKDDDAVEYFTKMHKRTFDFMIGCTALLISATPFFFWLLIKGEYDDAYYQLPVLIIAMFFFVMSSYFGGIYIAHKQTTNVGISTTIAAVINLLIDIALVNVIGIWAGSISTLVSYLLLYIYRMINCQSFQKININIKRIVWELAIVVLMLILCFYRNKIVFAINVILGIVFFCFSNRDTVLEICNRYIKKTEI